MVGDFVAVLENFKVVTFEDSEIKNVEYLIPTNSEISHTKGKFYFFVKRLADILLSGVGLICLSPIFLILALLIKLDDGGPVFYKHMRVGKNEKPIGVYKFRSMKLNADKLEDVLSPEDLEKYKTEFKIDNDPRITKIGNFLRTTSLDELPQILNIFLGDLTLIGPRPIVTDELKFYGDCKDKFLSVKPGLTGYWQAYARNNVGYVTGKRQEMELYYIDNYSFWLDIKIFFATFAAVFKKQGSM